MGGVRSAVTWVGTALAILGAVHQRANLCVLRVPPADPPDAVEPVSVLVPARDEAHRIAPTVRSLLAQSGVPDLEVLVLDDGSSDGTAEVVHRAGAGDPRLRVLAGSPPPDGTLGKPHACAQLAAAARGRVLVYVDADVLLEPRAVAASVALLRGVAGRAPLDLLCPWPRQLAGGPLGRLLQPLQVWSWSVLLPLGRAERSPRPSMVAANGQFLLVDAAALERAGGFAVVAGDVLDDLALARAVKRSGGRVAVADGSAVAACRMYDDDAEVVAGYGKSLWAAFGSAPGALAVAALLTIAYLVPPAAALGGSRVGLVGYAAAVVSRAAVARRVRSPVWPDALAHPVSVAALLGLLGHSWTGHRRGTLSWKGRRLGHPGRAGGRA